MSDLGRSFEGFPEWVAVGVESFTRVRDWTKIVVVTDHGNELGLIEFNEDTNLCAPRPYRLQGRSAFQVAEAVRRAEWLPVVYGHGGAEPIRGWVRTSAVEAVEFAGADGNGLVAHLSGVARQRLGTVTSQEVVRQVRALIGL